MVNLTVIRFSQLFILFICWCNLFISASFVSKLNSTIASPSIESIKSKQSNLIKLIKDKSFFWSSLEKLQLTDSVNYLGNKTLASPCFQSIKLIVDKFYSSDPIGLRMIDSSASFPNGFLDGTLADFGDFDECLSLKFTLPLVGESVNHKQLTGKHCMVKVNPILDDEQYQSMKDSWMVKNNFPLNIAICIPSTCSANEIQSILSHALYSSYRITEKLYCDEPFQLQRFLNDLSIGQLISIANDSQIDANSKSMAVCKLQDFVNFIQRLEIDDREYAYLKAIVLFSPENLAISLLCCRQIEKFQEKAVNELRNYVTETVLGDDALSRFGKLLLRLMPLRSLLPSITEELFFSGLVGNVQIESIIPYILKMDSSEFTN